MKWIMATALLLSGCSALLMQQDGFEQRIEKECGDLESCRVLLDDARRREDKCQRNTIGVVRCEDARRDLRAVESRYDALARARALEEGEERANRRRAEWAAEQRVKDEIEARNKAEHEQRVAEQKRKEDEAYEKKAAEMMRVTRVDIWANQQIKDCALGLRTDRCHEPPAEATEEEVTRCKNGCLASANGFAADKFRAARKACIAAYVESQGRGTPACMVDLPDSADTTFKARVATCSAECLDKGKEEWAQRKREIEEEKKRVRCCDGTRSPSCTYGGSLRGCCSHHGGVC